MTEPSSASPGAPAGGPVAARDGGRGLAPNGTTPAQAAHAFVAAAAAIPLRDVADAIADIGIFVVSPRGDVVSWNTGARQLLGYDEKQATGRHLAALLDDDERREEMAARALATAMREGRYQDEAWFRRHDSVRVLLSLTLTSMANGTYACVLRNAAERGLPPPPLDDSERRFKLLVQGVTDYAIYMIDPQGHVANWNAGAQRIKGYSEQEIIGHHFSRFFTDEDREAGEPWKALRAAAAEGRYEREGWRVRKDGTRFRAHVVVDAIRDASGELLGFAKITRDVTERYLAQQALEQAQKALFESQKMEAIGRLTGGVAHDFNNLLTVIVNNLALIAHLNDDPRTLRMVQSAQRAAEQGAKLTQQLLAYARRQPLMPHVHNVNTLVRGFGAVLRRACGETIDLRFELSRARTVVKVDAQQFESALLNLVVNASDAMPLGGRLTISTDVQTLEAPRHVLGGELPTGRYVVASVQDQGTGMAPEVLSRALEPFYTTKDIGKGTGLGLSQVYGFASQSGGSVDIRSTPGEGTLVQIWLPYVDDDAGSDTGEHHGNDATAAKTALIVEDDADVLAVAVDLFRTLGYEVLTAADGPSALQLLESDTHIDVLFSDVVMPSGLNGIQLARRARKLRPELKILLASGYPMAALAKDHGSLEEFAFVSKPYRWTELAAKLRETA